MSETKTTVKKKRKHFAPIEVQNQSSYVIYRIIYGVYYIRFHMSHIDIGSQYMNFYLNEKFVRRGVQLFMKICIRFEAFNLKPTTYLWTRSNENQMIIFGIYIFEAQRHGSHDLIVVWFYEELKKYVRQDVPRDIVRR